MSTRLNFSTMFKDLSDDDVLEIVNQVEKQITEKQAAKAAGKHSQLTDFRTFINTYFSHYITAEFGLCQNQLIRDIESFRNRRKRTPARKTRAMPRGFGKSSIVSLFGVLWLVLNQEHRFVIILSSSKSTAMQFLQAIIDEIEQNDLLIQDYPELLPAKDFKGQTVAWRDAEIVFTNGVRIMALGWLNSVRGLRKKNHRPDLIICDDPDEEKDINSETRMERKYRWFDRAVLRLGGILGVDVFVNYTTISENCIGEYIYKNNQKYSDWDRQKFKAIETGRNGIEYSTWPEGAPIEQLQAEREADPLGFATEKQNEPLPEANQRFKGKIQVYTYPPTENWTGWKLALGVDLSLGKNESSDYSAIIGLAMSPEGRFYQVYEDVQRRLPDQIERDILSALLNGLPWSVCGIEVTANQSYFLGESTNSGFRKTIAQYNRTAERKILTPLVEVQSTGDKVVRITSRLQSQVANGMLKLRDDSILLYKQLNEFPHGFRDAPDALDFAFQCLVNANEVRVSAQVKVSNPVRSAEDIQRERFEKMGIDFNQVRGKRL
ncbi:MAG: hypothetical protein E6Q35_02300 [Chryseobacterium cucumeris]|nr:MAG: hypothetical protein E6Q35_02300 [Chryseobacterium cucumeris]